ncbi:hypothetical protein CDCA_CDCA09G2614 [Cyanidium caldarium]|uniref:Rab3 GTPase-activating protein catalytic subunit n=1 Tax=Cyanidium caldarium TaxID=2771 RepID=A0AAV9IWC4_CYACA|nr:hypothetical protein CDCA_CDCA09G2614 [Cyanidium caldarium]
MREQLRRVSTSGVDDAVDYTRETRWERQLHALEDAIGRLENRVRERGAGGAIVYRERVWWDRPQSSPIGGWTSRSGTAVEVLWYREPEEVLERSGAIARLFGERAHILLRSVGPYAEPESLLGAAFLAQQRVAGGADTVPVIVQCTDSVTRRVRYLGRGVDAARHLLRYESVERAELPASLSDLDALFRFHAERLTGHSVSSLEMYAQRVVLEASFTYELALPPPAVDLGDDARADVDGDVDEEMSTGTSSLLQALRLTTSWPPISFAQLPELEPRAAPRWTVSVVLNPDAEDALRRSARSVADGRRASAHMAVALLDMAAAAQRSTINTSADATLSTPSPPPIHWRERGKAARATGQRLVQSMLHQLSEATLSGVSVAQEALDAAFQGARRGHGQLVYGLALYAAQQVRSLPHWRRLFDLLLLRLHEYWAQVESVPGVPPGEPDWRLGAMEQQLQLLNACVALLRAKSDSGTETGNSAEIGIDSSDNSNASPAPSEDAYSHDVREPRTQLRPILTSRQLQQEECALLQQPDVDAAQRFRTSRAGRVLWADMAAFKHANPRASFVDFVRWFSPRDARDHHDTLSERMQRGDGLWQVLWQEAPALPVERQPMLFDPVEAGDRALAELRDMSPPQVLGEWAVLLLQHSVRALAETYATECESIPAVQRAVQHAQQIVQAIDIGTWDVSVLGLGSVRHACDEVQHAEQVCQLAQALRALFPDAPLLAEALLEQRYASLNDDQQWAARAAVWMRFGLHDHAVQQAPIAREYVLAETDDEGRVCARTFYCITADNFTVATTQRVL